MIVRFGWLLAGTLLALAAVAATEIRFLAGTSRQAPDPVVRSLGRLVRWAGTPRQVNELDTRLLIRRTWKPKPPLTGPIIARLAMRTTEAETPRWEEISIHLPRTSMPRKAAPGLRPIPGRLGQGRPQPRPLTSKRRFRIERTPLLRFGPCSKTERSSS